MKTLILFSISLFATALLAAPLAAADDVVCPAVFPCNADGSVQPPFNKGDCAPFFAEMCRPYAYCEILCENTKEDLMRRNRRLRRELRVLKRQVK